MNISMDPRSTTYHMPAPFWRSVRNKCVGQYTRPSSIDNRVYSVCYTSSWAWPHKGDPLLLALAIASIIKVQFLDISGQTFQLILCLHAYGLHQR